MQKEGGQRAEACSLPPPYTELEVDDKKWTELVGENWRVVVMWV